MCREGWAWMREHQGKWMPRVTLNHNQTASPGCDGRKLWQPSACRAAGIVQDTSPETACASGSRALLRGWQERSCQRSSQSTRGSRWSLPWCQWCGHARAPKVTHQSRCDRWLQLRSDNFLVIARITLMYPPGEWGRHLSRIYIPPCPRGLKGTAVESQAFLRRVQPGT